MIGYPFVPAIFVIITLLFVLNSLIEKPTHAWAGLLLMVLALPVFLYFKKKGQENIDRQQEWSAEETPIILWLTTSKRVIMTSKRRKL